MKTIRIICCALTVLLLAKTGLAQTSATGIYQFGSYQQFGFDTVNRANGNIHFSVPIVSKGGRAGTNFSYASVYDSLVWSVGQANGSKIWTLAPGAGWSNSYGNVTYSWNVFGNVYYTLNPVFCQTDGGGDDDDRDDGYYATEYDSISYIDAQGQTHTPSGSMDGCGGPSSVQTSDGYAIYDTGAVRLPNGTTVSPPVNETPSNVQQSTTVNALLTDTNGNQISEQSGIYHDTTGTAILSINGQGTDSSPVVYQYPLMGGQSSAQVKTTYVSYQVSTNFRCYGILDSAAQTVPLVDRITFPDGSFYAFTYESNQATGGVTGRLASVTLPTGGTIQYTYGSGGLYGTCTGINGDGSVAQLTRMAAGASSNMAWDTTQAGNQTLEVSNLGSAYYNFTTFSGLPYESKRTVFPNYPPSGAPLLLTNTTYDGQYPVSTTSVTSSNNGGPLYGVNSTYNSLGEATSSTYFDYGTTSAVGAAIQYQSSSYNTSGYLLNSLTSTCSSCATISSATYNYDETTPTTTSGLSQHVAPAGARNNLTSIVQHVPSATDLTTTNVYDDAGSLQSTTTVLGKTAYTYDSSDTYLIKATNPIPSSGVQLASTASYDSYTGILTSAADPSNISSTLQSSDSLLRPISVTTSYGNSLTYSYANPNTVQVTGVAHGSGTIPSTTTQLDPYGLTSSVFTTDDNATYRMDYSYDFLGRVSYVSPSYTGSSSASKQTSGPGPAYGYDNLGRLNSITTSDGQQTSQYMNQTIKSVDVNGLVKLTQSDAIGRPLSICEVSSTTQADGTAPSSCGNSDFPGLNGFMTTYQYGVGANAISSVTVTQGVQTRTFQTDALGRTVSVTEPERGTTTYAYSYNGTGLQIVRNRAKANQNDPTVRTNTTSQYDNNGRLISVNYDDNLTPPKQFGYDFTNASPYGVGRLGFMTDTQRTSAGFVYDNAGRLSLVGQCLIGLCGQSNYDIQYNYTYYNDGLLQTESYKQIGYGGPQVTNTYKYSAASYLTSLTQTTGQSAPVSIIADQSVVPGPNGITQYGTGNQAITKLSYDSLGRQTGAISCLGGTPNSGNLNCGSGIPIFGYSAGYQGARAISINTTLQGSGTPGYDDLGRLTSMKYQVGQSTSSVQMSYDRYGNRSIPQNGQIPIAANNHDGLHSYDAAGNVTDNGAYTYDAEGNLFSSSDGMQRFYDALNRLVYQYNNNVGYGRLYAYGLDDKRRGVFDGGATKLSDVIYANGQPVAYWDRFSNSYNYQYQNQVGTDSGRENNGSISTFSSLPFGDAVQSSGQDSDIYHYAGLDVGNATTTQWDQSTLQHAQFREYSPSNGHWFSPDPYDGSYTLSNPQSFNRYNYSLNSPLSYADPSGQDQVICDNHGSCGVLSDPAYAALLQDLGSGFSIDGGGNIICPDGSICGSSSYFAPFSFSSFSNSSPIPYIGPSVGGGRGQSTSNNGNPNNKYPLLNTQATLHDCAADAKAAVSEQTGKILDGNWIGTTAGGVILRAVAGSSLTFTGVAEGAAFSFGGRALWYGAKGLFNGGTTGAACAISTGTTSMFNSLTGPG